MITPKFTVAVVGGGIGGLTLALALTKIMKANKQKIIVNLYESAQKFTEIGAGVGMFPRPSKILNDMGLELELEAIAFKSRTDLNTLFMTFRKGDQPEGVSLDGVDPQAEMTSYHRAQFLDVLSHHVDTEFVNAYFNKRMLTFQVYAPQQGKPQITLHFKDGTTAFCDVLVGADGIHSATRDGMYQNMYEELKDRDALAADKLLAMKEVIWSGSVAYRGVLPRSALEVVNPDHHALKGAMNYIGKNHHLIVFPISGGQLINVVAFYSEPDKDGTSYLGHSSDPCSCDEMLDKFKNWEPEVLQLLNCIDQPRKWPINMLKGLPAYNHGNVAVIGDAAHAMPPHQGSGAGQAIEDAYILATLLGHPLTTLESLTTALEVYDAIRRPMGNNIQAKSRHQGRLYEFVDPEFADLDMDNPPADRLEKWVNTVMENWKWAWTTDANEDKEKAITLLESKLA